MVGVTSMAEDSAAMVISMAVDSAAGISSTVAAASTAGVSSTVAAEADPVVVVPTAAVRTEADIADRASTFRLCTNGWRLRQPFFFRRSQIYRKALQHKVRGKQIRIDFCYDAAPEGKKEEVSHESRQSRPSRFVSKFAAIVNRS
jgi:hypothetical protein